MKGTKKGTEMVRKRNEAGTKTSFIEKERGRNEIVNLEERPMPWKMLTKCYKLREITANLSLFCAESR